MTSPLSKQITNKSQTTLSNNITIGNKSNEFVINLQQVRKCQVATSLILTDLLQVVLSDLSRLVIHKLAENCLNNLQQACG
jgi:hypothetical protein